MVRLPEEGPESHIESARVVRKDVEGLHAEISDLHKVQLPLEGTPFAFV